MIRFVYFDLGNVLVGFSHPAAVRQLAALSGRPEPMVRALLFDSGLQWQYERGELDTPSCCRVIRERLGCVASNAAITSAISDIFWPLPEMIPVVAAFITARFPFGILSNTCDAHWNHVTTRTLSWLERRASHCVLSFREGTAKPEAAIYERAAELAGCEPDELFFVDDRAENVEAACQLGWQGQVFSGALTLGKRLRDRGLRLTL